MEPFRLPINVGSSTHHRQHDGAGNAGGVIDVLLGWLICAGRRVKNAFDEGLWVAVNEKELQALKSHHDAMTAQKGVFEVLV